MSPVEILAQIVLIAVAIYLAIGVAVAVYLHLMRLSKVDPATKDAGLLFRLIITPGLVALWPLMLRRFGQPQPPDSERFASARRLRVRHRHYILLLALTIPLIVFVAIALRPKPAINPTILPEKLQQPVPGAIAAPAIGEP